MNITIYGWSTRRRGRLHEKYLPPLRPALRAAASEASVKAKVRQINFSAWGAAPLLKEDG
jgi:hypothetical protein